MPHPDCALLVATSAHALPRTSSAPHLTVGLVSDHAAITPGQDFWIGGVNMATGKTTRYHLQRSWWGVHFNSSRDDTLFASDHDQNPKPQMVDTWTVSPDRMVYTFKLRDGLKFHDGTPVTSKDVVASMNPSLKQRTRKRRVASQSPRRAPSSSECGSRFGGGADC